MRLQHISVTSSRPEARNAWRKPISSVRRLSSPTLLMSAASVTFASPAKCEIFPGGTPCSHVSVRPIASRTATCASRFKMVDLQWSRGGAGRVQAKGSGWLQPFQPGMVVSQPGAFTGLPDAFCGLVWGRSQSESMARTTVLLFGPNSL